MTKQQILIRDETQDDAAAISAVTVAAFASLEISSHTEQSIIEAQGFNASGQ
jgi:putative acetyltransferase